MTYNDSELTQYEFFLNTNQSLSPERMLMLAILEQALFDLQDDAPFYVYRGKDQQEAAKQWITQKADDKYIFSFVNICTHLGLDHSAVRKALGY
ncbi:MAG: hypothetical protein ACRD5H_00800 [Nitrososphaerales archaeon]